MYKTCRTNCSPIVETDGTINKGGTHYKHQCNYDERRRKAESRRLKAIQKLKYEYKINVDDLKPSTIDKMVSQMETFEKQKRNREKSKADRKFCFIEKLIQEEKYRRRGVKTLPPLRKKTKKKIQPIPSTTYYEEENGENYEYFAADDGEYLSEHETTTEEKSESDPCKFGPEALSALLTRGNLSFQRKSLTKQSEIEETQLKCHPSSIIFENCESNKKYKQSYKITNIGLEIIHCRCVGIEMKDTNMDQAMPFRVELMDNILLRPGLSFTSKIHFFSLIETPEMHGYLIYESRRKKNPNRHGIFRVPVSSYPARSIIDVTPTLIRFPSVSWCIATGKERSKYLKKSIRIQNTGTKDCSCYIANSTIGIPEQSEHFNVEEGIWDEDEYQPDIDAIISELIDNIFEVFRFSQRYFIKIPAKSIVKIDVDFIPEYKGYHHHIAFIRFEGSHNCVEEKIEFIGDIKKIPLRIEPSTIDLKICIINSGVYEGTFRVYNDSNNAIPLRLKVPGSMKEHSLVFPSTPVIQPWSFETCSVRLFPRVTLPYNAYRYYKDDTKVLEYPIFIQPTGPNACNQERLKLYVFAILTDYSLQLKPTEIDFGVVNTLETVRTEITLTNHSMSELEYGFLHLPMGVKIEPNDGFGVILPKETIPLNLLYSPVLNSVKEEGNYTFRVQVTSIQELGGFGERLPTSESTEHLSVQDEENVLYNTEVGGTPNDSFSIDDSIMDEDEDLSFIDPAEELKILEEKQNRIREYIRQKKSNTSCADKSEQNIISEIEQEALEQEEEEQQEELLDRNFLQKELNVITCKAFVIKPYCELSATVVLLPATPLSSFSTTRLFLNASKSPFGEICNCGFTGKFAKNSNERPFEAMFEFSTSPSFVSITPRIGHISQGESIPITIVFQPEISDDLLLYQSRIIKAESLYEDEMKSKEDSPTLQQSKSVTKSSKANRRSSTRKKLEIENKDINLTSLEITPCDLFAGQKAIQQMVDPFNIKIKAICTVTPLLCNGMLDRKEHHSLLIIAPIIRPRFIYLGKSQEIKFGKVTIGDRARQMLEIQNISLRRISPHVSALNPIGPFICTTGWKLDKIDPEHIWRHPITFAPTEERGKEEEFFEIQSGATTISLTVNGEGIAPKYKFIPDFELCVMEIINGLAKEMEFIIENEGEADLKLQFVGETVRASSKFTIDFSLFENKKSELSFKKTNRKNRSSLSVRKEINFAKEIPSEIINKLNDDFESVENPIENIFEIVGLNSDNTIILAPFSKATLKIRYCPNGIDSNTTDISPNAYAIEYKVLLAKTTLIKKFLVIGILNTQK